MVLQNKYKARASRRYNASRGGIGDSRGRGGGGGRGGRGRGAGRINNDASHFPSLNGEEQEEGGEEDEEDGEEDGDSAGSKEANDEEGLEGGIAAKARNKYSRRKLVSNAWRYQEEEVDPHEEAEAEPELEVDLSGLLARVAKLDSDRTTKALSSQVGGVSIPSPEADSAGDIDQSLLYLLDRQREREGRKGIEEGSTISKPGLTASELKQLEMEGKRLLEEKEREKRHHGRVQMLKSQQPKTISLNIGENRTNKDQRFTRQVEKTRRNINVAALYDDVNDDRFGNEADHGSVDAFLQQLDAGKPAIRSALSPPTNASHNSASSTSGTSASSSQLKEHQEFLDSII